MSDAEVIQEFVVSIPEEEVVFCPGTECITTEDNGPLMITTPQDDPAWREQALLGMLDLTPNLPENWTLVEVNDQWEAHYIEDRLTWGTVAYDPRNASIVLLTHTSTDIVAVPVEVVYAVLRMNGVV